MENQTFEQIASEPRTMAYIFVSKINDYFLEKEGTPITRSELDVIINNVFSIVVSNSPKMEYCTRCKGYHKRRV